MSLGCTQQCVSCIFPSLLKRQIFLVLFYSFSQIAITCFSLRPVHMVSDVQLTKKNGNTKRLAYKITFCENFTFTFCQKGSRSVLTKLEMFKNVHPSGMSSSPCPLTCSSSHPSSPWSPPPLPQRNVATYQGSKVSLGLLLLPPPLPQRLPEEQKFPPPLFCPNIPSFLLSAFPLSDSAHPPLAARRHWVSWSGHHP